MVPTFVDPSCNGLRAASRPRLGIFLPGDWQSPARVLPSARVLSYVFHDVFILHRQPWRPQGHRVIS
eukprot:1994613-Pyramimonas_sp.AAC.1